MFLCLYLQVVLEQLELLWKHPLMEEDKWMIEKKKQKNESDWIGNHSMKSACFKVWSLASGKERLIVVYFHFKLKFMFSSNMSANSCLYTIYPTDRGQH